MSGGAEAKMAQDPKERMERERLAVEAFGAGILGAAAGARRALRTTQWIGAVVVLIVLFWMREPLLRLGIGVVVAIAIAGALAFILLDYRRKVKRADEELRRTWSAEAHG